VRYRRETEVGGGINAISIGSSIFEEVLHEIFLNLCPKLCGRFARLCGLLPLSSQSMGLPSLLEHASPLRVASAMP
jgi:hypothetical protein